MEILAGPAPLHPIGLCAAWSHHAAELALVLGAELQRWEETPTTAAMVSRGELSRMLPGIFLPPDLLDSAVRRALAIGCALGGHLQSHHVLAGPTAAWVHLGGVPPAPVELLSPAHRGVLAGVVQRHARLDPGEIDTLGGAPVTTPRRTAVDLLRFSPEPTAEPLLRHLERSGLIEADEVRAHLHRLHRHPRVEAARERLGRILGDGPGEDAFRPLRAGSGGRAILPPSPGGGEESPGGGDDSRTGGAGQLAVSGAPAPTGRPSAVTR